VPQSTKCRWKNRYVSDVPLLQEHQNVARLEQAPQLFVGFFVFAAISAVAASGILASWYFSRVYPEILTFVSLATLSP
jgi:hypothetical protein